MHTPTKQRELINPSPQKKDLYRHVCINHPEKKAKFFVKDLTTTKYCSRCAIKSINTKNVRMVEIDKLDKENVIPEVTPFEFDSYLSETPNQDENSICRYNSDMINFMIDLE